MWGDISLWVWFALIPLVITDIEALFIHLLAICMSPNFGECQFSSSANFLIRLFFFVIELYEFFIYFGCSSFLIYLLQIFYSVPLYCFFCFPETFKFEVIHLLIFGFCYMYFWCHFQKKKKLLPRPILRSFSFTFSSHSFIVSRFMFKS